MWLCWRQQGRRRRYDHWSAWHYRLDLHAKEDRYACGLRFYYLGVGMSALVFNDTSLMRGKVCKRCWAYYKRHNLDLFSDGREAKTPEGAMKKPLCSEAVEKLNDLVNARLMAGFGIWFELARELERQRKKRDRGKPKAAR